MEKRDFKKEFKNLFDSICKKHSKFDVWNDFVHMSAYAISNAANFRQDRESMYMNIVKKYSKTDAAKFAELLSLVVFAFEHNRRQDFLGQLYMEYRFGDAKKGQYFTPYSVACMISNIIGYQNPANEAGYASINDPCSGTGVLLIAYTNVLLELGRNPQMELFIAASDIDPCIAMMCYIQLSLLGCAGYVCVRDCITNPLTGKTLSPPDDAYIMPMTLQPIWQYRRLIEAVENYS